MTRADDEEPEFRKGAQPERVVQAALVAKLNGLLEANDQIEKSFVLEGFGLDMAAFFRYQQQAPIRFFEVKAFVGSRGSGVGFGTQRGQGSQVDLLMQDDAKLETADLLSAWIVADGTRPRGAPRYAFVKNTEVKQAAMAGVVRGKQNNINITRLKPHYATWPALIDAVAAFLIS